MEAKKLAKEAQELLTVLEFSLNASGMELLRDAGHRMIELMSLLVRLSVVISMFLFRFWWALIPTSIRFRSTRFFQTVFWRVFESTFSCKSSAPSGTMIVTSEADVEKVHSGVGSEEEDVYSGSCISFTPNRANSIRELFRSLFLIYHSSSSVTWYLTVKQKTDSFIGVAAMIVCYLMMRGRDTNCFLVLSKQPRELSPDRTNFQDRRASEPLVGSASRRSVSCTAASREFVRSSFCCASYLCLHRHQNEQELSSAASLMNSGRRFDRCSRSGRRLRRSRRCLDTRRS